MSDESSTATLSRKDFQSDQEVRWCPGCGDYTILSAIQLLLPELDVKPENLVFVSGIGCAARLPYYMNTYGIHSIHGRAPAIATGIALGGETRCQRPGGAAGLCRFAYAPDSRRAQLQSRTSLGWRAVARGRFANVARAGSENAIWTMGPGGGRLV